MVDQIRRGIRLDVINVHERAIKYYGRMGYELVRDSYFVHPRWNTPSHVMVLPADPDRESAVQVIFQGIDNPVCFSDLADSLDFSDWRAFRREKKPSTSQFLEQETME